MRFVRYQIKKEPPVVGWINNDEKIGPISGSIFDQFRRQEATLDQAEVRLLAPVMAGKIICIGRNYAEHTKEQGVEIPDIPMIFLKPPSSLIGEGDFIEIPPQSQQVEHEAELAVVIGRKARWVPAEKAMETIFGYTVGCDVTARDLQRRDGQWTRGKGFDTFCPIGPWIETEFDPSDAVITCKVNGELRQMASTREMIFSIPQLVAYVTSIMTLEPGDLILTGTPAGIGPLTPGDEIEITIEGIGTLTNRVRAYEITK